MTATIIPTVGRKVWYYAHPNQPEPHDATIIKVHTPHGAEATPFTAVNLSVKDPDTGATKFVEVVYVGEPGDTGPRFRWMPYQQGQAAKAEAVERQRADVGKIGQAINTGTESAPGLLGQAGDQSDRPLSSAPELQDASAAALIKREAAQQAAAPGYSQPKATEPD